MYNLIAYKNKTTLYCLKATKAIITKSLIINKKNIFTKIPKKFFNEQRNFKYKNDGDNELTDKVNILSKQKFTIPERYKSMSISLKNLFLSNNTPYYLNFQVSLQQMVISRLSDFSINFSKGENFIMKNLLLCLIDYSYIISTPENKIVNVIICVKIFVLNLG